jgi:hypothetical protein
VSPDSWLDFARIADSALSADGESAVATPYRTAAYSSDRAPVAVQQPLAELGLQAPDLLADGGLSDPQPFHGALAAASEMAAQVTSSARRAPFTPIEDRAARRSHGAGP